MSISFPAAIDVLTNPSSSNPQNSPSHSQQHSDANDAIEALEAKVGVDSSAVTTSHDYKIRALETEAHTHVFNETPSGTIDGVNDTFTLANTPTSGTLMLFLNGVLQRSGASNDFVLTGATIAMSSAPETDSVLIACYLT